MEDFKFIGKDYNTEYEKQKILGSYDKYQIAKIRCFNETSNWSIKTKYGHWNQYNNHIHKIELNFEKDLKDFTKEEIENMINESKNCNDPTKEVKKSTKWILLKICREYFNYLMLKGDSNYDPCTEIKIENRKLEQYQTREEFYKDIKELDCTDVDRAMLTLLRYGVEIKYAGKVKWEDVDKENKILKIFNKNTELSLPIDDNFLMIIDNARKCGSGIFDGAETNYRDYGYVLKLLKDSNLRYMNSTDIHGRITRLFERVKIKKISVTKLILDRKYDLLFDIHKEYGKVTSNDIKDVLNIFDNSFNSNEVTNIKQDFESFSNITVEVSSEHRKRRKSENGELNKEEETLNDLLFDNFIDPEDSYYQNEVDKASKDNNDDTSKHKYKSKEKDLSKSNSGTNTYKRDAKTGFLALKLADFQCELNKEHKTFTSNSTSENYVEAHHIIPMKYYDDFEKSIDNEANIVALCPNCHRFLHYGKFENKKELLLKLYKDNIQNLIDAELINKVNGTEFEENDLIDMYKNC